MLGSQFRCNVCGAESAFNPSADWRESPTCETCGSSVRARQVIHSLTQRMTGRSQALPDMPRSGLRGIGLSDWEGIATPLARAFDYTNSFYHQEPLLDICRPRKDWIGTADFLISSDVFEHVPSPAFYAFLGASQLLRPGGLLVLTIPCAQGQPTIEHYPAVREFRVTNFGEEWLLVGRTEAGTYELHQNPVFHGGPGTTVEMRVFGYDHVVDMLDRCGFEDIRLHVELEPTFGVFPRGPNGCPITAVKRV